MEEVGEVVRGRSVERFIAEEVYLVFNSFCDGEPVKRSKNRRDMVRFILFKNKTGCIVLNALKGVDCGVGKAREKRVAVV
jgi:hypothetical protein